MHALGVTDRAKVLKGEAYETCLRILRLIMSAMLAASMPRDATSTTTSKKQQARSASESAVQLVEDLFSSRSDAQLLARADNRGVDCMRARAFFLFAFALVDYLEGGSGRWAMAGGACGAPF